MMLTIQAQGLSVSHQWYNLLCPSTQNTLSAHYHYHVVTPTCFVVRTHQVSSKCIVVLPKISHFITTASSLLTTRAFSKVQHTRRLPRLRSTSEFQAEANKHISEAAESFTTTCYFLFTLLTFLTIAVKRKEHGTLLPLLSTDLLTIDFCGHKTWSNNDWKWKGGISLSWSH